MKKFVSFTIILTLLFTCFACIPMQAAEQSSVYVQPISVETSSTLTGCPPEKLYDGKWWAHNDADGWISDGTQGGPCWLIYEFEKPIRIESVAFIFSGTHWSNTGDFTIQARNGEDEEWDLLATKVDITDYFDKFVLHTDKAYKYLKFDFTESPNGGDNYTRIYEIFVEPVTGEAEQRVEGFSFEAQPEAEAESGNKLFTLPSNSTVVTKALVVNNNTEDIENTFSAVMLVGVYDANGKLLKLATSNQVECASNEIKNLEATITTDTVDGTQQLRALVYQDTTNFKPLAPAAVLSSSAGSESFVWHFDERSGSKLAETDGKYTASLPNGALWVDGISGTGLSLPYIPDTAIEATKVENFTGDLSGDFTMSAYVKSPATATGFEVIVAKAAKGTGHIELYLAGGVPYVYTPELNDGVPFSATKAVNDGTWHQVTVTRAGSTVSFYIDGELNSQTEVVKGAITNVPATLAIGNLVENNTMQLIGQIDEVQIYNRALTEQEIQASMVTVSDKLVTRLDLSKELGENPTTTGKKQYAVDAHATFDATAGGYTFDGATNYIDLPDFDFGLKNAFTIAFDAKIVQKDDYSVLFAKYVKDEPAPPVIAMTGAHAELYMNAQGYLGMYSTAFGDLNYLQGYDTLGNGEWHHIAVTCNSDKTIAFYVDGALKHSVSADPARVIDEITDIASTLRIGGLVDGGYYFQGTISSVEIYDTALTAAEIAELAE